MSVNSRLAGSGPDRSMPDKPHPWPLYAGLICLAVAVVPFVQQGVSSWRQDDAVRDVVIRFLRAVAAGDQEKALGFLTEDARAAVQRDWQRHRPTEWVPTADLEILILSVKQHARSAEVHVSAAKDGYSLKPVIRLKSSASGRWDITQIEQAGVDPRWIHREQVEAREAEEALAEELSQALQIPAED